MAISCSPADLVQATACLKCIPRGMQREVMIYLLAQLAGVPADAGSLINAAACLKCIPKGMQDEVITYLLCQLAGGVTPAVDCAMVSGDGAPTGIVTPQFTGQLYYDATGAVYYRSTGLTSADWTAIGGASSSTLTSHAVNIDTFSLAVDAVTTAISFPDAVQASVAFAVYSHSLVQSISCPSMTQIGGGGLYITDMPALTTLDFSSLASSSGPVEIDNDVGPNTALQTIAFPALTSISGNVYCGGNPALANVSMPLWVPQDNKTYTFNGCALTAASVELILRRCVLAGLVNSIIDVSGGTNAGTASLNAQGQADVVTLGAQLTINP